MRRRSAIFGAALLLMAGGVWAQSGKHSKDEKRDDAARRKVAREQAEKAREAGSDPDRNEWLKGETDDAGNSRIQDRWDWFYKARAYPNNTVPANAQQRAWEQAQLLPVIEPVSNGPRPRLGGAWQFWGPDNTDFGWLARVNAIAINPTTPSTIYAGVSQGGLWKSTDSGATWANLTDALSSQVTGCITLAPSNANIIYYGTGEIYSTTNSLGGVGIWRSPDGGATWTLFGNSVFAGKRINHIVIDPANANHWVVSSDAGIYATTDGGATFVQKLALQTWTMRANPANANVLYAGVESAGLYKSTDGGNTWTQQTTSGLPTNNHRMELDISADGNTVYVAFSNNGDVTSLWKTTNSGASWASLAYPATGAQAFYDLLLRVDPSNANTVYLGTMSIVKSTNGGASWGAAFFPGYHPDQHVLAFDPTNSQKLYVGNDGGLFYSANGGTSYDFAKNSGRGTMEFYGFDVHPTDPNKLMAGAQDNGPHIRSSNNTYIRISAIGGDGANVAYNHSDGNKLVASAAFGYAGTSSDGGTTFSTDPTFTPGSDAVQFIAPLLNDPVTGARFYTGTTRVFRSDDSGNTWASISGDVTKYRSGYALNVIAVAPSNPNTIYAGASDGGVAVNTSASPSANPNTWTQISAGLPNLGVGGLAVNPTVSTTVYVGMQGYGSPHVWKSVNGGTSWVNISGSLPDTPVNALCIASNSPTTLFAATDVGVFVTTDNGATWSRYGTGLPTMQCIQLKANVTTGYLTTSTYGRGMWRIALSVTNPTPTLTSISPNSAAAGSAAFTLTVNGSNFIPSSVVNWNGSPRATTYVSSTQLTAAITAADVAAIGTANVTVVNPMPGGGTSNTLKFTIGSAAPIASLAGSALQFDGSTDAVNVGTVFGSVTNNFIIEFWCKPTATRVSTAQATTGVSGLTGQQYAIYPDFGGAGAYGAGNAGVGVSVGTNGISVFEHTDNNITSTLVYNAVITGWTHIAVLYISKQPFLLINGGFVAAGLTSAFTPHPSADMSAATVNGTYGHFAGSMDEVRIWNKSRTSADIAADVNASLLGNEAGLVAYFRMDETSGTTLTDAVSGGPTGTFVNTPSRIASGAAIDTVHVLFGVPRPITLASFNPGGGAITYSVVSSPTKGTLIGAPPNVIYNPGASYAGADQFTYKANSGVDSNIATVKINFGSATATLTGTITFSGIVPSAAAQNVTFEFRPTDGSPNFTRTLAVPAMGAFSLPFVPLKNYALWIKGDKWLAKVATVTASGSSFNVVNVTENGGDATGDNAVDIGDFGVLVNAYGGQASVGGSGYNILADFNGDGTIDIGDFGLLVNNYGQMGAL